MADDGQLNKLKEQYVDDVLTIVPLSQACFIVLMVIVSDYMFKGETTSVIDALTAFGLKSALGPDAGKFWDAKIVSICVSFWLALLNVHVLRKLLARSLRLAGVAASLAAWQQAAVGKIAGLSDEKRLAIHGSLKLEIDERLRKFKGRRIAAELTASIFAVACYANVLLIGLSFKQNFVVSWSWLNALLLFFSFGAAISLHRASVRYAIARVLPLKVYAGVLNGELVFFEEMSE